MGLKITSVAISTSSLSLSCSPEYYEGVVGLNLQSICTLDLRYTTEVEINFSDLGISWEANSTYSIEVPGGFFKDKEGMGYDCQPQTFTFTTGSGPNVSSITPLVDTIGYNSPVVTLKFDHTVKAGSGNIKLYNADTLSLVSTINVTDTSKVSFRTGNCVINLRGLLSNSTTYYMTVDSGAIKNLDNFIFSGISDISTIRFQTGNDLILGPVTQDLIYNRGGTFNLPGSPVIVDTYSSTLNYTMSIEPSDLLAVSDITNGSGPYALSQAQLIHNPDPDLNDAWGSSNAFSRDKKYLVIGSALDNQGIAPYIEGSVSIYENISGTYTIIQTITNSDINISTFGTSVSISSNGNVISFGGAYESTGTPSNGKFVKIYRKSGSSWIIDTTFSYLRTEASSTLTQLSGDGNTLAVYRVGSSGAVNVKPSIVIYKYNGSTWNIETTLSPTELSYNDVFWGGSYTLSNNGNLLVVPSSNQSSYTGAVYIYRRSGSTWSLEKKLSGSAINQSFGAYTWLDYSESKLYIYKNSTTEVYSYTGSDWSLVDTIGYVVIATNHDDTTRIDNSGYIYRKIVSTWIKGKQVLSSVGFNATGHMTQDLELYALGAPGYVESGVSNVGAVEILKATGYGVNYNQLENKMVLTLPKDMINSILSLTSVTAMPDNPSKHDQGYIQDFEIIYTLTTPDNRTDYKTQIAKFY